ncbi:c2h2 finger domain containing protein [Niveomyces insectorum RCEF 264]|uniref:C2h2 finger domain containing protein n=1 Tax=Niveomyces insectorum RCEF 264 TaxID=1081102 RepID=A0A167MLU3_9HYPO|nr:c2h2 finger domain containing protein [Niveomyces insectorum RCEF 264]
MGAEQSTGRNAGGQPEAARKTCYYELLSVERTATDDEIKKAYRRKALELHPDRNLADTANATRRFAEVQTAYEILSDPQERSWYDSHRDAILRGDSGTGDAAAGNNNNATPSYYNDVRLTSTDELLALMGRFNASVPFDDSPRGFFGILAQTFAHLSLEEEAAVASEGVDDAPAASYPPFGRAADDYDAVAKPFYRAWANFATRKSFRWRDKYRLADAPDRAVRRLMEKENRKARELAARDFNDAGRRRGSARPTKSAEDYEGGFSSDAASEVQHEIECVVCRKAFKSEKQFEAHEKSKKHIKAVQQLRRQMKKENKALHLDAAADDTPLQSSVVDEEVDEEDNQGEANDSVVEEEERRNSINSVLNSKQGDDTDANKKDDDDNDDEDDSEDDEYAPREVVEKRFQAGRRSPRASSDNDDNDSDSASEGSRSRPPASALATDLDGLDLQDRPAPPTGAKKPNSAKAKREKKAARQAAAAEQGQGTTCTLCHEAFSSNTKLHKHLRTAHPVAPPPRARAANGGGKKKKKG